MDNLIFSRSVTSPALLTFLPSISRSTFPSHTPGSCWRSKAGGFEHLSGLLPVGPTAQSQGGVTAHPPRTHLQPGRDATWLHSITWALNYTRCHPIRTVELQTHNVIHYRPLNFKHMTSSTTDQWTTKTHDVNYLTLLPNTKMDLLTTVELQWSSLRIAWLQTHQVITESFNACVWSGI